MTFDISEGSCELCGSASAGPLFVTHDLRYGGEESFTVLRCKECSFTFTRPRIQPADFRKYYPEGFHYSPDQDDDAGALGRLFHAIGRVVNPGSFEAFPVGPILDVGCGNGLPSQRLIDRGHTVVGVEIDSDAAASARARGLDVRIGDFLEMSFEPESFRSVIMRHSLEHLTDFRAALEKANALLRPGGVLYVCLPNLNSLPARLFGRHWFQYDVPRHIYHFTLTTLERALDLSGFRIDRVVFDYSFEPLILLRSLEYLTNGETAGLLGRGFRALHVLLYPLGLLMAATSLASSMNVYALKQSS